MPGRFRTRPSFQAGGDAGRPKRVAADLHLRVEISRAALDHQPSIDPVLLPQFPDRAGQAKPFTALRIMPAK
jgi:hypothetical protein